MSLRGLTDGDPTSAAFKNGGLLVVCPSDPPRNRQPTTAARTDVLQASFDFQGIHAGAVVTNKSVESMQRDALIRLDALLGLRRPSARCCLALCPSRVG